MAHKIESKIIDARAEKNGGARVREHNKIDYYNKRGKALSEKLG